MTVGDPIRDAYAGATGSFRAGLRLAIASLRRTDPKLAVRLRELIGEVDADIAAAWDAQREAGR